MGKFTTGKITIIKTGAAPKTGATGGAFAVKVVQK